MKYETPELTTLTPAISAIQGVGTKLGTGTDTPADKEVIMSYEDWE